MISPLEEGFDGMTARLIIGDNLLLTWAYEEEGSLSGRLVFTACEGDGTKLCVVAVVPPPARREHVPGSVVAEVVHGAAAAARRLYPAWATVKPS